MPRVPLGKRAEAMAICPLRTSVKRSRISFVGLPMATVRVMSVVPSRYCAPLSMRNSSPAPQLAVGRLADAVVHDGAVGAAAGDGVEADLAQLVGGAAEAFQAPHRLDLVERAGRGGAVEPGEKARDGEAVAQMRGARALDLGCVLDRLQRQRGIGSARDALGAAERARKPIAGGIRDRAARACRPCAALSAASASACRLR